MGEGVNVRVFVGVGVGVLEGVGVAVGGGTSKDIISLGRSALSCGEAPNWDEYRVHFCRSFGERPMSTRP